MRGGQRKAARPLVETHWHESETESCWSTETKRWINRRMLRSDFWDPVPRVLTGLIHLGIDTGICLSNKDFGG